jgi:large subunit ribosomal protein L40
MRDACELLRTMGDDGVIGGENEGRLFRVAMQKKGIWDGVPIEYARLLTDWPSRKGWDSEWVRPVVRKK